jgi:hypothetical protein
MHAPHFAALEAVSERVEIAKNLLERIDEFESGAREMKQVVDLLSLAESRLTPDPIGQFQSDDPRLSVDEMNYLHDYYFTGMEIISKAFDAQAKLDQIIIGWNTVVAQAENSHDFTRGSTWDAINQLDLRFSTQGAGFLRFLTESRDTAARVEYFVRLKLRDPGEIACVRERNPINYALCLHEAMARGIVRLTD